MLLGGAASGKSALAVRMASGWTGRVCVIATGQALDEEMADKIARHRANRPSHWETVEEPLDLAAAISRVPGDTFLIVDCLTLWLSNLMEKGLSDEAIGSQSKEAATSAAGRVEPTVAVSNEVGAGIVPANALARRFRNLLGRMNSQWADAAEKSLLLVAGRADPLEDPTKLLLGKHA